MPTPSLRHTAALLFLFLAVGFGTASTALAQSGTVRGVVTDSESGETIPGATVGVAGTSTGTVANADGGFSLVLDPGTYTIEVRSTGFVTQQRQVVLSAGQTVTENFNLERSVTELSEVTVESVGRREEMVQDSPASVSVLSTEQVATNVGTSSAEALRNTTSIDMQQTGIDRREIVIRGFNNAFSGATYVLTDYRQAAVASLGVNIYSIMPNMNVDVDRIEVVRGPGSALYGAGVDAGVVHFFTKDPFSYPGTTISLMGGERSLFGGQFRHAGTVGTRNRLGYKITGMYSQAEDWALDPTTQDSVFITQNARNQDYSKFNVNGSLEYRFSDDGAIIANGGISRLDATMLSGVGTLQADNFGYSYGQLRFQLAEFFAQVYVNMNDAGGSFVYGQDFDMDGRADPVTDNGIQVVANAQYNMMLADGRQNLVYGVDAEFTRPDTEGTILGRNEDDDSIDEYGAYLQSTTSLTDQVELTVALRGDYNTVQETFQVSPRAAVVYQPVRGHSFRATYNRAFSSPGTNSNFLDIVAAQVGGITVRGRGAADGYTWERDPSLESTFGTDLVASSLLPNILGQSTGIGAPHEPIYGLLYAGLASTDPDVIRTILNDRGIPITTSQTEDIIALLNPDLTMVDGQSVGQMGIPSLSGGPLRFINELTDIQPLDQTISQTFEVGYRGVLNDKLLITADAYYSKRKNFIGPLLLETPVVLALGLQTELTASIGDGIEANDPLRQALEAFGVTPEQLAGMLVEFAADDLPDSSTPIGIVQPIENDPGVGETPELMLTYRNFGQVAFWGTDVSFEYIQSDALSVFGNVSIVSDDFFDDEEIDEEDTGLFVALNAPTLKGRLGFNYKLDAGLSFNASGRYTEGFPVRSGPYVGDVDSYFLLDVGMGYDLASYAPGLRFDLGVSNALDNRHREFVGAPQLGRMAMAKLTYDIN